MYIITGICTQFFRIIIVQGSESKQISSCQIESDTLNAQLGQKLSLPESISDFQILQTQIITFLSTKMKNSYY